MEFWNFFTHIIGAALALFLLYKIIHIRLKEFVFTICMITCLGFSSAYHFCLYWGNDDLFVHKLDHCGIFLLIAGTSNALFNRRGALAILWAATASFVYSLMVNPLLTTRTLTSMYLLFGWLCTCWAIYEAEGESYFYRGPSKETWAICMGSGIMTLGSLVNLYNYEVGHIIFHVLTLIGSLFYVKLIFK